MIRNGMRPVHPGEILREEVLTELGMSGNAFAQALKVPANRITAILNGERSITANTALRLAAAGLRDGSISRANTTSALRRSRPGHGLPRK